MNTRTLVVTALGALALAAMLAASQAQAQTAPTSHPPSGSTVGPRPPGFLKAYHFRPHLYWGASLGLNVLPSRNDLCPGDLTCIGSPVGFGFDIHMGFRIHYLFGLQLDYKAYFFSEARDYYNNATWQSIHLDAHIYLLAGANIEVYLLGGGGVDFFGDKFAVETTGGGFEAGAGLDFVPSPGFTVGGKILYRGGVFGGYNPGFQCDDGTGTLTSCGTVDKHYTHGIEIMVNMRFRYVIVR